MSWGDAEKAQLTIGQDVAVTRQFYLSNTTENPTNIVPPPTSIPAFISQSLNISGGVPRSSQEDGGLFADASDYLTDRWKISVGGRFDYMNSDAAGG